MIWVILGAIAVAVGVGFVLLKKGGSRFARPPQGEVAGTWKFVADPERRQVAWDLSLPDDAKAQLAVHFAQWQLFYFGNGSASMDSSQELREGIRALLQDPDDCPWENVSEVPRSGQTLDLGGDFRDPGGFASFPGVMGVPRKADSLTGATWTLVQLALRDTAHAPRVRSALDKILRWHDTDGPAPRITEVAPRAYAALQAGSA